MKPNQNPDRIQEECAVFGVFGHPHAADLTYLGLYALQHRGQEGSGIVTTDGAHFYMHREAGLVADVFRPPALEKLPGDCAVGHNRYSTTGVSTITNVQPLFSVGRDGPICIAHNGNLVNARKLRYELMEQGALFQTTTDTEVVLHLLARTTGDWQSRMQTVSKRLAGAYTLLLMTRNELIGIRDPNGIRPLVLGSLNGSYLLASETCAFDLLNAKFIREIEPGELVVINRSGLQSYRYADPAPAAPCIFELIYFSRPDSLSYGESIDRTRRAMGRQLAKESPANADFVISVPDSSNAAALGYSQELGVPYEHGLIRNHYIGRTFINPTQEQRNAGVRIKFNPVTTLLVGKSVVVVEDSIVRGTTLQQLTSLLRTAGAAQIHIRVASAPIYYPCPYGMDFPTREELIANHRNPDEIAELVGADSLKYLSFEGMLNAAPSPGSGYCSACFSGKYPVVVSDDFAGKLGLEEDI
ncbi:MAG: amidophosphoribosyltransferase [bacterium]|nr:amidophosphoribosyltransferase [bacterium]